MAVVKVEGVLQVKEFSRKWDWAFQLTLLMLSSSLPTRGIILSRETAGLFAYFCGLFDQISLGPWAMGWGEGVGNPSSWIMVHGPRGHC